MFKVNNKDNKYTRTMPMASFWYLYFQLWTYFTSCSSIFIVKFEHVIAGWGSSRPEIFSKKENLNSDLDAVYLHIQSKCGNCNFIKKETLAQVFSCKFCEISKNTSFFHRAPLDDCFYKKFICLYDNTIQNFSINTGVKTKKQNNKNNMGDVRSSVVLSLYCSICFSMYVISFLDTQIISEHKMLSMLSIFPLGYSWLDCLCYNWTLFGFCMLSKRLTDVNENMFLSASWW